ncbi:DUF3892 domain-containing protein [Massilia timonae]|uniref:DUF3892 domain-containing protein n=2 Tax=Massilia TaxID=149698 RepID=UPI0023546DFB|nr:DUF3892 domain-containing protein [Massilia timonae]
MADCQITCINLSHSDGGHEYITHVGNGAVWRNTVAEVVAWIKSNANTFYVMDRYGNRADVGVVEPAGRPAYLRTHANGRWTDNLLSLTSCPR